MRKRRIQDPIDVFVGQRLRMLRALQGLSQTALAKELGITFQQLQKYETGANRISAGRLWQAAKIFGVPPSHFFQGLGQDNDPAADILNTRAGLELVRDFEGCSKSIQELVLLLSRTVAKDTRSATGGRNR